MVVGARTRIALLMGCTLLASPTLPGQETSPVGETGSAVAPRDGRHDFDFELGTWRTRLRRLEHPLSGSTRWLEYEGTSVVRAIWGGKANLVELVADGPAGRIEALSLRLYDPASRQWSLNFASPASGTLGPPSIGEFRDGRGEFHSQETFDGRSILVRFLVTDVTPDSCRFEQSFSDDGGRTWELNWVAVDTRIGASPDGAR